MTLTQLQIDQLSSLARQLGLCFIRVFGSSVSAPAQARDVDLAIGAARLELADLSLLQSELTRLFGKDVDLVHLKPGLNPLLIREIARHSTPLWEEPSQGRESYATLMDRLLGVAQDELLAYPEEWKRESARSIQGKLDVS